MNAAKLMTNKWVLVLGVAVLVGVMANASLADPPRQGGGYGDGYRGGWGGSQRFVDRDRSGDGDRSRGFGSSWQGGNSRYGGYSGHGSSYGGYSGYRGGYGGYPNGGCIRPGGYGGTSGTTITIIIR